ncbi:MAG: CapA family protein [Bdellovibrio sp.]
MKHLLFSFSLIVGVQAVAQTCPSSLQRVRVMAVGDIIFHGALLQQAMNENKGGFAALWKPVQPLMDQADLLYGNLEGPAAEKINAQGQFVAGAGDLYDPQGSIYSPGSEGISYTFNFHPEGVKALQKSGFEVLSLANNHSADRGRLGLDKTLELFESLNLVGYGTKHSQKSANWYSLVQKKGLRLAFVGCTYETNGGGYADQILKCYRAGVSNPQVLNLIKDLSAKVDLVVFTPHWGTEYSFNVNAQQKRLAEDALAAGARVILGSHPHVLQATEVRRDPRGEVTALIAYSLGNWVTNQQPYDYKDTAKHMRFFSQRISHMLFFELEKTSQGVKIHSPRFVPTYMAAKHETSFGGRALYPAYPDLYGKNKTLQNKIEMARLYLEKSNPFNVSEDLRRDHYGEVRSTYLKYKVPAERLSSLFCEN